MVGYLQRTETKLFLTVFLVYSFYATMMSPNNNIDALVVAMVDHGTFRIDDEVFTGMEVRVRGDHAIVDGRKYCGYSPGAAWLLAPWYWVTKPICALAPGDLKFQMFTFLASVLFVIPLGALCVVAVYRLLRENRFDDRVALMTALAFAFGTMWIIYARRHNSYSFISAALIFLSFALLALSAARKQKPGTGRLLLCGFLGVLGVAADYKNSLVLIWVGAYLVLNHRSWRGWMWFVVGGMIPGLAMLVYNDHVFGHPVYTPAKFQVEYFGNEVKLQSGVVPLVSGASFRWEFFWKQFVGPGTGLFLYVPVTLFALVGAWIRWPERKTRMPWAGLITGAMVLGMALLVAHFPFWHGSGDKYYQGPGTRYLLPCVPFLMILAAFGIERVKAKITYAVTALSCIITWMFLLSANYGKGESAHAPGWENFPLYVHGKHILSTYGAESIWFQFLSSSHFSLGRPVAALITWLGLFLILSLVWLLWRLPAKE